MTVAAGEQPPSPRSAIRGSPMATFLAKEAEALKSVPRFADEV